MDKFILFWETKLPKITEWLEPVGDFIGNHPIWTVVIIVVCLVLLIGE